MIDPYPLLVDRDVVCLFQPISHLSVNKGLDSLSVGEGIESLKALYSYTDRDECSPVHRTTENTSF